MKILLVDDTDAIRELVADRLSPHCEIVQCKSGNEAAKVLQTEQFDLIISDFNMPNGKGDVVLKAKLEHAPKTPFFFFTSEIDDLMGQGVSGIFEKTEIKKLINLVVNGPEATTFIAELEHVDGPIKKSS